MSDLTDEEKQELRKKWGISPTEQDLLKRIRKTNIADDDEHYLDTPVVYADDADEHGYDLIDQDNED